MEKQTKPVERPKWLMDDPNWIVKKTYISLIEK